MKLSIKDLKEIVDRYQKEVSGSSDTDSVASHSSLSSTVYFFCDDLEDGYTLELDEVEPMMLPGCGCWDGLIFRLKKVEE